MKLLPFTRHQSSGTVFALLTVAAVSCVLTALLSEGFSPLLIGLMLLAIACIAAAVVFHVRVSRRARYLQNVLDASPSGILGIDVQGNICFANPAACQIFLYPENELVGSSVEALIPVSIRGKHPELRSSFVGERRSRRMGEGRDIRGVTRNGDEIPLEIGLTFLGEGAAAMIVVGVIDIRELKAAQVTIERQNLNLARSVKELEQFAFIASHDLREPLRKVMNYTEIMQEDYASLIDEDGKSVLRSMASAVQRMERLLDSLLNYSRVTTRAQPFEVVALNDVVADVVEDLSLVISETGAQVQSGKLAKVKGDRNQIRQLLQNLVSNSLKYHRQGVAPLISIETLGQPAPNGDPGYVAITLRDNGIGFDNQYSELIFDVFKRLHGRDKYQGTGMGLAICRKIVERHEGFIKASAEVDNGATFCVWLKQAK